MSPTVDSAEIFKLLVDQVKDYAIFVLDKNGNVSSWNEGAKRIKGYTSDEIVGKHFSIFYTPEDLSRDHPAEELRVAVQEGRYEDEGWRVKKDGTRFWANVIITPLRHKDGNLTGFAKVTRDLTERKREADALRQKTEELEAFAHSVSHDLRAPLRSVSNFAQVLKRDKESLSEHEKEDYLDRIIKAAASMEGLINDVLKLSETSLAPAAEEVVSLDSVMDDCLTLLMDEANCSKAQIEFRKPLPEVRASRTLLIQIFSNLLNNALKFVPAGQSPKVEVYSEVDGEFVAIHVKDSGIGIPERYQERIFNMFDRGGADRSSVGTGIGLAIVKKAVERLGGGIAVKSALGQGSDFIVTLPRRFKSL